MAEDVVSGYSARGEMAEKSFEFSIFITSPPKQPVHFEVKNEDYLDENRFWGMSLDAFKVAAENSMFNELELYQAMKEIQSAGRTFGNVKLAYGRPNWSKEFEHVKGRHIGKEIGVAFCGNPAVASDLQNQCIAFTDPATKTYFRLHKENF